MTAYPISIPALRVEQPLGTFFVASIKASVLLDTCFSEHVRADLDPEGGLYNLSGTQRMLRSDRMRSIGEYISRIDAGFPNSIIIGANFRPDDGTIDEDSLGRWLIEQGDDGCYRLVIPSGKKNAAVIDGQHRLFAFAYSLPARLEMDLVCSIFLDLPKPLQASLFATINSTQTPVSKSLTYDLFGYNVEDEAPEYWSPDKLAVFLARRLALDAESPLRGLIILAPEQDFLLEQEGQGEWRVSMAVVVQGILRLISSNPRQDANALRTGTRRSRVEIADVRDDKSPLRQQYIDTNDTFVYRAVLNYLVACQNVFWENAGPGSFITKTVGVQALFDLLRLLLPLALEARALSVDFFQGRMDGAKEVDFSNPLFRNASGSGRTYIRKVLEVGAGLAPAETISEEERAEIFL